MTEKYSGPAAVAQTTGMVTFEIRTSLGLPVEDGSASPTNQFDQVRKAVIDGKVEFQVPFGARQFSLRALALPVGRCSPKRSLET